MMRPTLRRVNRRCPARHALERASRMLLAISTLCLGACTSVLTIDDVIPEEVAMSDDRLIGRWREEGGVDRAVVSRGEGRTYVIDYSDKEDTARLNGRIGRLGPVMVLDAYPDAKEWAARKESGLPTHLVFAIEFRGDSLGLRGIRGDSVRMMIDAGRLQVPYSVVPIRDVVLHGDRARMRAAMAEVFGIPRFLEDVVWYRRVAER